MPPLLRIKQEGTELLTHSQNLKRDVIYIKRKQKEIKEEYGIPWWQIALNGILTGTSVLFGTGYIKASGTAGRLLNAGRLMVRSIELGEAKKTKEILKNKADPEVENIWRELYGK